jgi:hypothetical protein
MRRSAKPSLRKRKPRSKAIDVDHCLGEGSRSFLRQIVSDAPGDEFSDFVKSVADFAKEGDTVRLPPVLVQAVAADDVASTIGGTALDAPVNDTLETSGPEKFPFDERWRLFLGVRKNPRQVFADPRGRYYDIEVKERRLLPEDDAILGKLRFEDWLAKPKLRNALSIRMAQGNSMQDLAHSFRVSAASAESRLHRTKAACRICPLFATIAPS